jgi:hypothetical protein
MKWRFSLKYWKAVLILGLFLLGGCVRQPVGSTTPETPVIDPSTAAPIITVPTNEFGDSEGLTLQSGGLTLTILSPADGETVNISPLAVIVISNIETVFTINSDLFVLAAGKENTFLVSLVDGYNAIEIVASDYERNQVDVILTVIFEK